MKVMCLENKKATQKCHNESHMSAAGMESNLDRQKQDMELQEGISGKNN